MAEPLQLPKLPDPIAHLRAGVDAHAAATQAAVEAGAQVQLDKQQPAEPERVTS